MAIHIHLPTPCKVKDVNRGESDLRDAVETLASALRDDNEKADLKTLTSAYKNAKAGKKLSPSEYEMLARSIQERIGHYEEDGISTFGLKRALVTINRLKSLSKDSVNHLGEQTYRTYEAWKTACKKQNPSTVFEGNKDICNAKPGVGEWDGETGVIYKTKTRDSAPSVGEKVRVQAEPGRMVEGTIRSLRGNMATVA